MRDTIAKMEDTVETAWPLFGLRLRLQEIELRPVTERDAVELAAIVEAGIVAPGDERFIPRLLLGRAESRAERMQAFLQYHWRCRAELSPERWELPFSVFVNGELVGNQSAQAESFSMLRNVHTGSFLARSAQGRGIGTRMRAMVVEWAFKYLEAESMSSGYHEANHASARVSARLGYQPDSCAYHDTHGVRWCELGVRLPRSAWPAHRPGWLDELHVTGFEECREMLGG